MANHCAYAHIHKPAFFCVNVCICTKLKEILEMQITCPEARQMINQGAQLLDVRSPAEFAGGSVPGAMNIPVQVLGGHLGSLDPSRPVIVYCASGGRSAMATNMLKSAGFGEVRDLGSIRNYYNC
jgi:phage shock protein E